MHASYRLTLEQQKLIQRRAEQTDAYAFVNVLTGLQLLDGVEALLPTHREQLFPRTETLSMFLAQVLSADGAALRTRVRIARRASACRRRWSQRWPGR